MVRAKFKLESITSHSGSPGAQTFNLTFNFTAQCADHIEENKRYHKYTPGSLNITVDNPPAQEFFKLGKSYYLDFTEAE